MTDRLKTTVCQGCNGSGQCRRCYGRGRIATKSIGAHGLVKTYTESGCRCEWCGAAMSIYAKANRAAKKTAA